ncbi:MAG: RecQ family ATP-dependent DNA helicase [Candidatus Aminicenantes bacterium]|nr:RecQ family ATP-dependent DNA helicase [Candidatus Aminicenantes bacterium]
MKDILFFDLEVDSHRQLTDLGAFLNDTTFHNINLKEFYNFAKNAAFICGHNIFSHDLPLLEEKSIHPDFLKKQSIDTLYLSALLFPQKPYHKLVKDYKLVSAEPNNPVSDAKLAHELFADCSSQFQQLVPMLKSLFFRLLNNTPQFRGFFSFLAARRLLDLSDMSQSPTSIMKEHFKEKVCLHCDLHLLMKEHPLELACALSLIAAPGANSVSPAWLAHRHPEILPLMNRLRYNRCASPDCVYCHTKLDPKKALKRIFAFEQFRRFENDKDIPLQEQAVNAALDHKSFLAVFPTGGGKSLTFQLPALIKGEACRGLTVVISPLQALMKDQVDILKERHERTDAVAINSLLSPLERAEAVEKVETGAVSLLYISPEALRSNTILRIIKNRIIERFVIDEAHCFSSWGQDFRPDYLYIGEFLKLLQKEKNLTSPIPVSCFTATAKPSVVADIDAYFQKKLGVEIEVFKTAPKRKNLSFGLYRAADDSERFSLLLDLLYQDENPKIVYTTRVKRSEELADKLKKHGFSAAAYNGQMSSGRKIRIQEDFKNGAVKIIVATSAFGMGIDKEDISMVIHYNISDSLESYIQEAGRAGRDPNIEANCYALYDDSDLMGHFSLLNSTRLNKKEIYQVWQAIKKIKAEKFSRSALELARGAGWDAELRGWETRIKTALTALEESGFIKRGQDRTRVFATALQVKNMEEAADKIRQYGKLDDRDRLNALRIIKHIISYKSSRVDQITDILGIKKYDTRRLINELKGLGILGGDRDLSAYVNASSGAANYSRRAFEKFSRLEIEFLETLKAKWTRDTPVVTVSLKEINSDFLQQGIESDIESLRSLIFTWLNRGWINKNRLDRRSHVYRIEFTQTPAFIKKEALRRLELARRILDKLIQNAGAHHVGRGYGAPTLLAASRQSTERGGILNPTKETAAPAEKGAAPPTYKPDERISSTPGNPGSSAAETLVEFSIDELRRFNDGDFLFKGDYAVSDYDKTLLYLNDIAALRLHDGLFVYYNPFSITRCDMDSRKQYTNEDYEKFALFYQHKIEQIHIVGEYAKKLVKNYKEAMSFVDDYFTLDYKAFIKKHFPGRLTRIRRPITEEQFEKIYRDLSPEQLKIINDNQGKAILVAAGPGSGKTRVLVHKVASLLTLEDVKSEQFLMLTYSRSAANEMKTRLFDLIGKKSRYIDIHTFHSFAFNIVEIKGDLEQSADIIPRAIELIKSGRAVNKVENKSVLVIDEFQDISGEEFELIEAIIAAAGEIRVLAVGDDDQNIFEFRGSSALYMKTFQDRFRAVLYHLNTNYRAKNNLVQFSNFFVQRLSNRVKAGQTLVSSQPGENGSISITKYKSGHLITPLTAAVVAEGKEKTSGGRGSTAVLTATNDEALQVYTLLRQQGIKAELLVSYADFSLKSLVELKMFSFYLKEYSDNCADKIIPKAQWRDFRRQIAEKFSRSKQLALVLRVIDSFFKEQERLLEIEWREYLDEVKLEDFIFPEKETIFVSTMHKAKGKEFDFVFLLLDNFRTASEEQFRVIYVALTRAKENLFIHTDSDIFNDISVPRCKRLSDETIYAYPDRLSLQLTPKDVFLDFFTYENTKKTIKNLQSGDVLLLSEHDPTILTYRGQNILKFSNSGADRIERFLRRGYAVLSLHAEYIVIWKKKEDEKQYRIVLPRIELGTAGCGAPTL